MNYNYIIDRICSEKDIDLSTENREDLFTRLEWINEYVQIANDSLDHKLNSTQVISYIVFDFFKEKGLIK